MVRVVAAGTLLLLLLCAAWRIGTSSQGYVAQDRATIAAPLTHLHPAGTDELGRDRATRLSVALLLGLAGAACASAVASGFALGLGGVAAFGAGWVSRLLLYATDLFLTLPWLFLLLLVRSALPLNLSPLHSELVTFSLLALLGAPAFLRMHHEKLNGLVRSDWLLQARASGLQRNQIARQLWPHVRPLLWTQFLLYIPACLIAEANLGTMGLGLSEPLPSLGNFLANLQSAALLSNSHVVLLPVAVLVLALAALELTLFGAES